MQATGEPWMPVLSHGGLEIEYSDAGDGPAVVLIHCSVSGIRQWRSLTEVLSDRYRVRALNLYGYGATTPWPEQETQTLEAQARIVVAACEGLGESVSLVGHSFGGTVALKAAALLGSRVGSMVLIEPNPVYLLAQGGRDEEFAELRALRDHVKRFGALGDWETVAKRFADYWVGDGAWCAMPEARRAAFAGLLPPNFHEWDAAMGEQTTVEHLAALACRTLVLSDPATRRPIRAIAEILAQACPDWTFRDIPAGGHMAPVTRPDLVNPMIRSFLDAG
jgi:pimeloyl-ACP methyl ester carboxylesterase